MPGPGPVGTDDGRRGRQSTDPDGEADSLRAGASVRWLLQGVADAPASQRLIRESGDDVEVGVKHFLATDRAAVPTDVVAVRLTGPVQQVAGLLEERVRLRPLVCRQVEDGLAVGARH